ncbi:HNH endonuclease signature motif containing protein [Nocardioides marinquilinus]|uniref:HNH endonuclease signature motif containing protein n=1 Tax=Nocardioides marinquilinus TaxID=1210400 RepID=A0ABP9PL26_9ACTN
MDPSTDVTDAAAAALGRAVDELVAGLADEASSASHLPALAGRLAHAVSRLQAAQAVVAERLDATGAAEALGWASTKDFLTHVAGGRKGAGGAVLRLAEHTRDLPAVRAAMLAGDVTSAQAGVIGRRVATLPHVPELRSRAADVMLAQVADRRLDATDLDRAFGDVLAAIDPDGSLLGDDQRRDVRERGAHHARYLALTPDEVGGVVIRGYATVEDAELVRTALVPLTAPVVSQPGACGGDPVLLREHARDADGRRLDPGCPTPACNHDGADPRDHGARLLDALVETCRRVQHLTGPDALPTAHGVSARLTVTIDHRALEGTLGGDGLLGSGQSISATAVRRLACDAEVLPAVLGTDGQVLDLGRTRRLVTTPLWSALVLRDRHCTFPGCTRPPVACEAHHLRHWADGGVTSLDNLALLCRRHHTTTHQTPWRVHLDPTTRRPAWTPPPRPDGPPPFTFHRGVDPPVPSRPPVPV